MGPGGPAGPSGPAGPGAPTGRPDADANGWSAAEVLVATGALSLVAAVAVFAAVAWDDLAGVAKAGILLGLTALTAALALAAKRRGLGATAEAVGLVAVTLGLADVQIAAVALEGDVAPSTVWSLGLATVAAASVGAGRAARLRAVSAAGVGLAFLPAVVLAGASSALAAATALTLLALAAALLDRSAPLHDGERAVLRTGGTLAWLFGVAVAGVEAASRLWSTTPMDHERIVAPVAVLVGLTAVAVVSPLIGRWSRGTNGLVLAAAPAPALLGVAIAALAGPASPAGVIAWVLGAAVAMAVAAEIAGDRDPQRPWTALAVTSGLVALALAVVPVVVLGVVAAGVLSAGARAIEDGISVALSAPIDTSFNRGDGPNEWAGGALVAQLLALAALGAAWIRRRALSELGGALAVTGALGAAFAAAVHGEVSVALVVGGFLALTVGAAIVGLRRPGTPLVGGLGAVAVATAALVALGSSPLLVVTALVVVGAAAGLAVDRCDRATTSAASWIGGASALFVGATLLVGVRIGLGDVALLSSVVGSALLVAVIGPLVEAAERAAKAAGRLEPWQRVVADVAVASDVVAGLGLLVGLALVGSVDQGSVVVGLAGIVAGLSSLRPSRPSLWRGTVAAAVIVTWLQLSQSGIEILEAYTLPLAAAVLVVAGWGRPTTGSWDRFGVGLALAVGPTALLALEADDLTRAVIAVAAGTVLLLWGAVDRLQAPLVVGALTVGAIAVRHLAPIAADLPRYLVLGGAGIVLLAVGATFEQRRQDLRRAQEAYESLG